MNEPANKPPVARPGRTRNLRRRPGVPGSGSACLGSCREETGPGDVIKHATSAAGIRPCRDRARRAATLNRQVLFTRTR